MNGDADNFESLRRLLALKRHEVPPPGYFQSFSGRVIARIEAGERGEGARGTWSWLQWLWVPIEQRPVLAGAFGAAVCALLVAGILNTEQGNSSDVSRTFPGAPHTAFLPNQHSVADEAAGSIANSPLFPGSAEPAASAVSSPGGMLVSNTNSVEDMFHQLQLRSVPVNSGLNLMGKQ